MYTCTGKHSCDITILCSVWANWATTILKKIYKAISTKCFVSHRPTGPFFWKSKKKNPRITCKEASNLIHSIRSCLINTNCLKLSSILRFCSLLRHLIVLLIYIFYRLIISCRLNVRFNMQSCVHSFFFCPTSRPTFTRGTTMGKETVYGDGLKFLD